MDAAAAGAEDFDQTSGSSVEGFSQDTLALGVAQRVSLSGVCQVVPDQSLQLHGAGESGDRVAEQLR